MDTQSLSIQLMFDNDLQKLFCSCGKQCKTLGFFKRHLVNTHNWVFRDNEDPTLDSSCEISTPDSSCKVKQTKFPTTAHLSWKMLYCSGIRMMHFLYMMENVLCVMPNLNFFVHMFGNIPNRNCGYRDLWLIL